ncbi:MAG TPA: preprotein translocase subunit YajC [Verrucomicrobiae bacterium]|jgi:preprotein translocase subunit YajC
MMLHSFAALLAMAPPPSQPGTQPNPTGSMVQMLGMFAIMGLMFYFLLIRPQQKKAKEHASLLSKLKAGDKIVTSSGLVAVVVTVKDRTVSIRSGDAKLEVLKSAVTEITEVSSEA